MFALQKCIVFYWYNQFHASNYCQHLYANQNELFLVLILLQLSLMITPIVTMTWFNCYKVFQKFYYADTKDTVFDWFRFLVCMKYFQFLFELIILEVQLIASLELRFSVLSLSFNSSSPPSDEMGVNQQIPLFHHLLVLYHLILLL